MKYLIAVLILVLTLATLAAPVSAGIPPSDEWPMFHHDLSLSGCTTSEAPDTAYVQWTYDTGVPIDSSPAVADEKVFIGSGTFAAQGTPCSVYCLNKYTGALIWSYPTGDVVLSSPAVAGGKVFVGSMDGNLYALDEDTGAFVWKTALNGGVWSSPAVHNDAVFVSSTGGNTYSLNKDTGGINWSTPVGGSPNSMIAVDDGKVFAGTHTGNPTLIALDETTGATIWTYNHPGGGFVDGNGAAIADGRVYFGVAGSVVGEVICLPENDPDSNGVITPAEVIWTYTCRAITGAGPGPKGPGWVTSTPAVQDGKVWVGSDDEYIYCLDATTGTKIWDFKTGACVWSSPAVADGKVYVGSNDHKLYCLDENSGGLIWDYDTGLSRLAPSPAIANGKVFIGSYNGKVYAFGRPVPPPGIPTLSQWGMIAMATLFAGLMIWIVRRKQIISSPKAK